jgi:hypothetical protein
MGENAWSQTCVQFYNHYEVIVAILKNYYYLSKILPASLQPLRMLQNEKVCFNIKMLDSESSLSLKLSFNAFSKGKCCT